MNDLFDVFLFCEYYVGVEVLCGCVDGWFGIVVELVCNCVE